MLKPLVQKRLKANWIRFGQLIKTSWESGMPFGMNQRYNEAARKVKERKEHEARLTEEKQDRYQNILNRFIAEGRATLRAFAFSNRTNFNDKEAASIYYGIMTVAHKMELSLGTKEGITSAVNGCADQLTIWDGTKNHIINESIN